MLKLFSDISALLYKTAFIDTEIFAIIIFSLVIVHNSVPQASMTKQRYFENKKNIFPFRK